MRELKYMHEVERLLRALLQADGAIHYLGNSSAPVRFTQLLESKQLALQDRPDAYIKGDNELWIIEHFEFENKILIWYNR